MNNANTKVVEDENHHPNNASRPELWWAPVKNRGQDIYPTFTNKKKDCNNASRPPSFVPPPSPPPPFVPPPSVKQVHHPDGKVSAEQWAGWDKDYLQNRGQEIYLTITNMKNYFWRLLCDEEVTAKIMEWLWELYRGYELVCRMVVFHLTLKQVHGPDGKVSTAKPRTVAWNEEYMKKRAQEEEKMRWIYSTITNKKKDSLLLSDDVEIAAKTMERLWKLLAVHDLEYGKHAFRSGAARAIAKVMNLHPCSAKIQGHGCAILSWFTLLADKHLDRIIVDISGFISMREESTWAKPIVDAGGIETVIAAMGNHPDKIKIQSDVCRILCNLAEKSSQDANVDGDYRKRIFRAKGLVVVVEAQRIHEDNAEVVSLSNKAFSAIRPQE